MMRENSTSEMNRHLLLGDLEAQRNCEEKGARSLGQQPTGGAVTGGSTGRCSGEQQDQQVI